MKSTFTLLALTGLEVTAFPAVMQGVVQKRQVPSTDAAQPSADHSVSTTGEHAYASPLANQIRGPCPGLNAAANHAYLDRSGVTTIPETITGLGELFGMSPDLAGFLAAYAIIFDGDPLAGTWSIGGPPPPTIGSALLGTPPGISYSHNNHEGDSSIARRDAYINNGDAHSLDTARFASAYSVGVDDGSNRYTLDKFAQNFGAKADESVQNNPYYFAAPFSTTLVSPAAYNFVINFMSNHTAEEPSGYLDGEQFKTWFAVTGEYPNFQWLPGKERIPDNWYRRTFTNQYNAANVLEDLGVQFAAYPDSFRLGGNTNGVNTYEGADLTDLTGGAFNNADLLSPNTNGAACFYAQAIQAITPAFLIGRDGIVGAVTSLINEYIKPFAGAVNCPVIDEYNESLFGRFPGYKYNPTGPANNYK